MMKYILATLVMTAIVAQAESAFKIGYVDMQKAVQTTTPGKKAKTELEAEFNKRKKDIEKKESDLTKRKEELEKKRSILSEEVLGKKQIEFREEMTKYQELVQKNQMDIQKNQADLTQPILEKMRKVISNLAKAKGYGMVIENSPMLLYVDSSNDLTDEVIRIFEKE